MRAGIGLGSNLGDRLGNIASALKALGSLSSDPIRDRISSIYETRPIDCADDAPNFLNAAMEIEITQSPLDLLRQLQSLEEGAGRPATRSKNSPRSLDLDLLYVDDLTLNEADLILPHPFIYTRQFVLFPLSEISPNLILPGKSNSITEALKATKMNKSEIIRKLSNL